MTVIQHSMHDEHDPYGKKWPAGTVRCFFNDGRKYWGVSYPGDNFRLNCLWYWPRMEGEYFDGEKWVKMARDGSDLQLIASLTNRTGTV